MPKRLGKVVSRGADVGDSVIVSAKIADATIVSGDIAASVIGVTHLKGYNTSGTIATTTGAVISHNLGVVPAAVILTQISSAKIGHLFISSTNASQAVIGTDVSGILYGAVIIG